MTPNTCSAHARTMHLNRELPRTDYALPTSILETSLMHSPIFFLCAVICNIRLRSDSKILEARNFTSAFFFLKMIEPSSSQMLSLQFFFRLPRRRRRRRHCRRHHCRRRHCRHRRGRRRRRRCCHRRCCHRRCHRLRLE